MTNLPPHGPDMACFDAVEYELQQSLLDYPVSLPGWSVDRLLHQSNDTILYRAHYKNNKYAVIKRFNYQLSAMKDSHVHEFISSVDAVKAINCTGLVDIYNVGLSHNHFYILMEYFKYDNLLNRISLVDDEIVISQRLEWFKSILMAVVALHNEGLLHRDLKLSNIMFREDELVLVDCGIASGWMVKTGLIEEGSIYCTPAYVSPERAVSGVCNVQTEIYSLGVIFYELLTNIKPYNAPDSVSLIKMHVLAPIPILPEGVKHYQNILCRLLAKHPENRFHSVEAILWALKSIDAQIL